MQLVDQHTKKIMEGCKERAADAGLKFDKETLEYIVTNADMLELSPKNMIPTLYDYWLQDIQVLQGKGEYEIYPHNPYETVINTRPVISFYNQNNPDWLNVMIFYHVIGHIDFFQNNKFFEKTWDYDFKEKALTEKRMIARLRSQYGRQLDYVIEFAKGIDNLVGYYSSLNNGDSVDALALPPVFEYYFNHFLLQYKKVPMRVYLAEIDRYNFLIDNFKDEKRIEDDFFRPVMLKNVEFMNLYEKFRKRKEEKESEDIMQYIIDKSEYLNKKENRWMKGVINIIRETSLYFAPMIRTKTMNEGWASYWHEKLFLDDDRIKGNEVAFARINAKVTSISRVGLNPYAIGWRLFMFIEEMMNKGKYALEYTRLMDIEQRKKFDKSTDKGMDFIFFVRENYCDLTFLNSFVNQEFVDKYNLMVVGQRINRERMSREYYVKSRKAEDYKDMLMENMYHPPFIKYSTKKEGTFLLEHVFEGKEIYKDYIPNTLIGLEYLWGKKVEFETQEIDWDDLKKQHEELSKKGPVDFSMLKTKYVKVRYHVENKQVKKSKLV